MSSNFRAPGVVLLLLVLGTGCLELPPLSSEGAPTGEEPAEDGALPTPLPETAPPPPEPQPAPKASAQDDFGTRHLYPSAPGGRTWAARWNEHPRTLRTGQVDPYDPEFQLRGSGHTLEIAGDGTARSSGWIIRYYIGRPDKHWLNTEVTLYAMRVSELERDSGSSGFEFQTRTSDGHLEGSHRNAAGLDRQCDGHAYSYSLRFDGRAVFQKELKHPLYTSQVTTSLWDGQPLPRDKWVGIKVITYDLPGGQVKQELWLDLTDGENGGTWQKVHEHLDAGGWGISPRVAATCRISADQRLTRPEPLIILRNHGIREQRYKKATIREIQPPSP